MMKMEEFSRVFDGRGIWSNYLALSELERVIESVAIERAYPIKKSANGNGDTLSWSVSKDGEEYHLHKTSRRKMNYDLEYPVMDDEWKHFVLMNGDHKCLEVETHLSIGSNSDGTIEFVQDFDVRGSLFGEDDFARTVYQGVIEIYNEFEATS